MFKRLDTLKREEGFTLIELMIVMVVLGILAGIVIFALGGFEDSANQSVTEANTKQCEIARASYAANPSVAWSSYFDGSPPSMCATP